jgi:sporulation protein YlmC with PRC-barrel domain
VISISNIREWSGQDVLAADGSKVGKLESVYVDTTTDQAAFGTVTVGMVGRHRLVFVPLDGSVVGPDYVKVIYDKSLIKDAPSIETDGELPAADEPQVFGHYGMAYAPGAGGERRLGRR